MSPRLNAKYDFLLEDPDVKRWYDNTSRGSRITADVYLRRLGSFCLSFDITPKNLAARSETELYNMLLDRVSQMEKKDKLGSYIESEIKSVKSWLNHSGKDLRRKIRINGARDAPSLKDERVPTKEELRRVFLSTDKKTRVACVLVAHSGVRIQTVGDYHGDDGLRLGDLPELQIESDGVCFKQKPALVVVRKPLSKARHQYFTFLSEEGCEYVKDYLDERLAEGEELTLKSPLVTPKLKMKSFIRSNNVGDNIRCALRSAGLESRPYVLRSYFDTQLMLAESKGLVLRDYRAFFMGHKGDIENRYTTNKGKLPESVIDDMRASYMRSQEFLQTKVGSEKTNEERLRESFRKQLMLVAGFGNEEVDKLDVTSISDEELQSLVRKKLLGLQGPNGSPQKVISVAEANNYLDKGWQFVAKISDNQIIIKMNQGGSA
jgi:hypothetical protein